MKIFYDGSCRICRRIAEWIRRKDTRGGINLHDISDGAFIPEIWSLDETVWDEPHGLVDSRIVRSSELVREVLGALGYKRLTSLSRLPVIHALFNWSIKFLSKNRYWLGRFI